jgi:hypothetical protein
LAHLRLQLLLPCLRPHPLLQPREHGVGGRGGLQRLRHGGLGGLRLGDRALCALLLPRSVLL